MVSTPLKNIRQIGNLPQIGMKIKNIWNHHLEMYFLSIYISLEKLRIPPLVYRFDHQNFGDSTLLHHGFWSSLALGRWYPKNFPPKPSEIPKHKTVGVNVWGIFHVGVLCGVITLPTQTMRLFFREFLQKCTIYLHCFIPPLNRYII